MKWILNAGIFLAGLFTVGSCYADNFTCEPYSGFPGETATTNISGTISVGEDMPVGSVIYQALYTSKVAGAPVCHWPDGGWTSTILNLPYTINLASIPRPVVPGVLNPKGGLVYETNVPGIGVSYLVTPSKTLPYESNLYNSATTDLNPEFTGQGSILKITLQLIKTAEFNSGTVDASTFSSVSTIFNDPTMLNPGNVFSGFPMQLFLLSFSGQVQVVKSTCQVVTENIVVDLGSHETTAFNGVGSTTEWKDASIKLTGCSGFTPGYFPSNNYTVKITGPGDFSAGTPSSNRVAVTISPASTSLSDNEGIIALTSSPDSAQGIGIQIGYTNNGGTTTPLPLSIEMNFAPPAGNASTMEIPLFARYIQTENSVVPGKADGAVVYLINYY